MKCIHCFLLTGKNKEATMSRRTGFENIYCAENDQSSHEWNKEHPQGERIARGIKYLHRRRKNEEERSFDYTKLPKPFEKFNNGINWDELAYMFNNTRNAIGSLSLRTLRYPIHVPGGYKLNEQYKRRKNPFLSKSMDELDTGLELKRFNIALISKGPHLEKSTERNINDRYVIPIPVTAIGHYPRYPDYDKLNMEKAGTNEPNNIKRSNKQNQKENTISIDFSAFLQNIQAVYYFVFYEAYGFTHKGAVDCAPILFKTKKEYLNYCKMAWGWDPYFRPYMHTANNNLNPNYNLDFYPDVYFWESRYTSEENDRYSHMYKFQKRKLKKSKKWVKKMPPPAKIYIKENPIIQGTKSKRYDYYVEDEEDINQLICNLILIEEKKTQTKKKNYYMPPDLIDSGYNGDGTLILVKGGFVIDLTYLYV